MQTERKHGTGAPHPFAPHVCTPLPAHCVLPGEQALLLQVMTVRPPSASQTPESQYANHTP
jgi:hypothetical protein